MKFIVTVDTEEDNWGKYSRIENPCSNIEQLLLLQELFDSFNVCPTYLVTYPVVKDEDALCILKKILLEEKCEIGTHCHPWNTPPFNEVLSSGNTMLSNLPYDLIFKKITTLHNAIIETFGIIPIAFRAGRFAFNNNVAKALTLLDYKIDTSITPYEDQTPYLGPDFSNCSPIPYIFSEDDIFTPNDNGKLVEIPLSTGYLQSNFQVTNFLYKFFRKKPYKYLRIVGILSRLGLLNMASLCPETNSEKEMIGIANVLRKKNVKLVNLMFHSSSLKAGFSPFAKTKKEQDLMFNRIKSFLQFARDNGIENIRISDAVEMVKPSNVSELIASLR